MLFELGVPEAVQRKSPIWPQFSKEETSARPTAEQMVKVISTTGTTIFNITFYLTDGSAL